MIDKCIPMLANRGHKQLRLSENWMFDMFALSIEGIEGIEGIEVAGDLCGFHRHISHV